MLRTLASALLAYAAGCCYQPVTHCNESRDSVDLLEKLRLCCRMLCPALQRLALINSSDAVTVALAVERERQFNISQSLYISSSSCNWRWRRWWRRWHEGDGRTGLATSMNERMKGFSDTANCLNVYRT